MCILWSMNALEFCVVCWNNFRIIINPPMRKQTTLLIYRNILSASCLCFFCFCHILSGESLLNRFLSLYFYKFISISIPTIFISKLCLDLYLYLYFYLYLSLFLPISNSVLIFIFLSMTIFPSPAPSISLSISISMSLF